MADLSQFSPAEILATIVYSFMQHRLTEGAFGKIEEQFPGFYIVTSATGIVITATTNARGWVVTFGHWHVEDPDLEVAIATALS